MGRLAERPRVARNRLDDLRRLDWRFLLPVDGGDGTTSAVLIGADDVLVDAAGAVGLATHVSAALPAQPASVDLVAVLGGNGSVSVADAARALRPGGSLYWEVDRRRTPALSVERASRSVRAAGLVRLGSFAVRPHLAGAELYVPLDSTASARWYARSVYIAARPIQVVVEGVARLASLHRGVLAAATPFHVVVAQKPPLDGSPLPARVAPRLPAVLSHGGTRAVLVWCDERARPSLVAKVPKVAALEHRTIDEQENVTMLRDAVPGHVAAAGADARGVLRVGRHLVALESGQPGVSMARTSGRHLATFRTQRRDLLAAAQWLVSLHRDGRVGVRKWDADTVADVLEVPIRQYDDLFGTTEEEQQLFDAARARAASLSGELPVVWEHGDFTVWNVYRRPRSSTVAVLDWEGARCGLPYVDLCRFAVHWTELASGRERTMGRRALLGRTLFGDDSSVGTTVRQTLDSYLQDVDLDPRIEPVLITRLYAELAVRRHCIAADAGAAPDRPRDVNPALQMVGHLATYTDRLFG